MIHTYNITNPDDSEWIMSLKESNPEKYEQAKKEFVEPKEGNFEFKVVFENDEIELYSNVSPNGVEWAPVKIDDYILTD